MRNAADGLLLLHRDHDHDHERDDGRIDPSATAGTGTDLAARAVSWRQLWLADGLFEGRGRKARGRPTDLRGGLPR